MNPRSVPPPKVEDYIHAVDLGISAGVRGIPLTYTWSSLEPAPGKINVSGLKGDIAYATSRKLRIYVGIQVINTVKREVPPDLVNEPFDSPKMMSRFRALLDQVIPGMSRNVLYVSIGNEVDGYLAQTGEWSSYRRFYENALAYVHQKRPGTKVGVTSTFTGTRDGNVRNVQGLNSNSDVFIFTYYPLHGDFQVDAANAPATDFPLMLNWAGGKPVVLQEVGYPSGTENGSSPAREAQFVTSALSTWKAAGNRIPFFSYFLEHDLAQQTCVDLAQYYGIQNDPAFVAFLCTLGLRAADDSNKPAWDSFVAGAPKK